MSLFYKTYFLSIFLVSCRAPYDLDSSAEDPLSTSSPNEREVASSTNPDSMTSQTAPESSSSPASTKTNESSIHSIHSQKSTPYSSNSGDSCSSCSLNNTADCEAALPSGSSCYSCFSDEQWCANCKENVTGVCKDIGGL